MSNSGNKHRHPFSTEQFLKAVDDSSRRSRNILLMLAFSSLLVLMALINSMMPKFNWFKSKIEINNTILKYVIFRQRNNDTLFYNYTKKNNLSPVRSLSEFIYCNEKTNIGQLSESEIVKDTVGYNDKYPLTNNLLLENPQITPVYGKKYETREKKYKEIGSALKYIYNHNIVEKDFIKETLTKLEDAKVEHLDLIRVPILGITFHVNYLGVYGGAILATLCVLLYFSLYREKVNLKIAFKRGWSEIKHHHYYLYEYATMLQVLAIPQKLFGKQTKRNRSYKIFAGISIFLPLIVFTSVLGYDIYTFDIGNETNHFMTIFTFAVSILCMLIILLFVIKVSKLWQSMNYLWDNQAYEFNIEYILEAINEDKRHDLTPLYPTLLTEKDKFNVRYLWYELLRKRFAGLKYKIVKIKTAINVLKQFVEKTLKTEFVEPQKDADLQTVESSWLAFREWFNSKGKKSINVQFATSCRDMIEKLRKKHFTQSRTQEVTSRQRG